MKVEFLSCRSDSVGAVVFFQQGGSGGFCEKCLWFTIRHCNHCQHSRFIASGCLESEMAAVLLTPAYGEFNF